MKLHYKTINPKQKQKTLILLGGLSRDHSIWRKVIPELSQYYQLLLIDNRDAGQSTAENISDYTIADMADDVIELIEHLALEDCHLLGHSMGGFMAMHIATKIPQRIASLILCSTAEKQVPAGTEYLKKRITLLQSQTSDNTSTANKNDITAVLSMLYAEENLNEDFINEVISAESNNPRPQSGESFIRQAKACIAHDATDIVATITCPTLIITGDKDLYYTPQAANHLCKHIKNASLLSTFIPL